jgi:SAM-dependent methyltransferase
VSEALLACEGCGAEDAPDVRLAVPPWTLAACRACGLVATLPRVDNAAAAAFHDAAFFGPGGGRRFAGPVEALIGLARGARARRVAALLPARGRLLDVGCGRGLMLARLAALGHEAWGTEVSPLAGAVQDPPAGVQVFLGALADLALPAAHFDAVTFFHSLEHVPDLARTLDAAARLLRPGGALVVAAPNLDSLQARLGGAAWLHLELPQHRHHFTPETLARALAPRGLAPVSVDLRSLEFDPIAVLQTALNRAGRPHNAFLDALRRVRRAPLDLLLGAALAPAALAAALAEQTLTGAGGTFELVARAPAPAHAQGQAGGGGSGGGPG